MFIEFDDLGESSSLANIATHDGSIELIDEQPHWYCSPLNDLCFGPSAYPTLSRLHSSPFHCVAIRTDIVASPPIPYPSSFKDIWDSQHVRMPCSTQSLYPVGDKGSNRLEQKWDLVVKALKKPIRNCCDLEETILSYNSRFSKRWVFRPLHAFFDEFISAQERDEFFRNVLPKMAELVLNLPQLVTHAIPLLQKQQNYSVTLSQQQIACLLANAFFCTFPRRNTNMTSSEYSKFPSINFNTLFTGRQHDNVQMNKIKCILNYFRRVTTENPTSGLVTFTRQVCKSPPKWENCTDQFTRLHITSEGTIEDNGYGMLQVDFANKYIGGGVLSHGCVQEEIRFLICPELLLSRLFTEELDCNESLLITGAERYSSYKGYASTFEWKSNFVDDTVRDVWGRRPVQVVAIDALVFYGKGMAQFKPGLMCRELNKAYCGFMAHHTTNSGNLAAVATGNWGCGAFGGDPCLKVLLQWMAASVAKRDVVYFTFDKTELLHQISEVHTVINSSSASVSMVWKLLVDFYTVIVKEKLNTSLFDFLKTNLK